MTTTIQPTRAPEVEAPENPDVIEVTISEVDRQTAGEYLDLNGCIIYTALRNRGINADSVGVEGAWIERERWLFDEPQDNTLAMHCIFKAASAPFYKPSVVGRVIRLRKVR